MRGFLIILIGSSCFLGSSYLHASHSGDGCNANDEVCMKHLIKDVNDSNDGALLGGVLVGFGIYYWVVDRPKNEKDELLKKFKEGKGFPIFNTNKFSIEIPNPIKPLDMEPSNLFLAENKTLDLLEFKYKFN